jgi:ketosteroid isomerase-like protein
VRTGFGAFASRDYAALAELFADDVVWHNHGRNPLSGDFAGKQVVFAMMGQMLEMNEGAGEYEVHDIVANNDHAVVLLRARTSRPVRDKSLDVKEVHVYHMRDGKIAEAWVFSEDQRINDEFWS